MACQANQLAGWNQQTFSIFYDTYAPELWGIILFSNLPTLQSEIILINTLKKAWQQLCQQQPPVEATFPWLLTVAYREGLPKEYLQTSLLPRQTTALMNDAYPNLGKSIPVLISGGSPDDQALLAQSLEASLPKIKTSFSGRTDQALEYLRTSSSESDTFPRLLVLSLSTSDVHTDWQLLQQIKASYRQLPIVVISVEQQSDLALEAYDLGINSFLVKSIDLAMWEKKLALLADYWLTIVTLPNQARK